MRGVLLGIFFTAVGMLFDPVVAGSAGSLLGLWVGAVLLVKTALVFAIVAWFLRRGARMGILTGFALAQTLKITGTPTLVLPDGAVLPGYRDADALLAHLKESSKTAPKPEIGRAHV